MALGEIYHPSASSPKNDNELRYCYGPPGMGFLAFYDLSAAILAANSFLLSDIILL